MIGRVVVLDEVAGRRLAALVVDGRLEDLLIDPPADAPPGPGAVFRGIVERPMKGQGGLFLRLPDGQSAFLRQTRGLSPGKPILVQVTGSAEPGKAVPVTTRLVLKGRYAIVTPGAPGLNVARSLRDEDERARLAGIASAAMAGRDEGLGLILRTACEGVAEEAIAEDVADLADLAARLLSEAAGAAPEALLAAPDAAELAWRDWAAPDPDEVIDRPGAFEDEGVWDLVATLRTPLVALPGGGTMWVEPTRALVAVDVNTGPDTSPAASLKANLAAARELPRQLRLRGLGGQVVVDFAPMPKPDRVPLEQSLRALMRADGVETALVGWTSLGLFELQRKRERLALVQALEGVWPE